MKRSTLHLFALLLPAFLVSCASDNDHGISLPAYKRELVKAIKKAGRIEVIEHSDTFDMRSKSSHGSVTHEDLLSTVPYFEYGRADLDGTQKEAFLARVQAMDPGEPHGWMRCIFQPHHTIRFYRRSELSSTMRICFACAQVEWLGDYDARPDALLPILADVVKSCGFSPDKDIFYWAEKFEETRGERRQAGIKTAPSATGANVRL